MTTPLIRMLVETHGYPEVDAGTVDDFLAAHEHAVLFFAGDAERLVESNDVAVILPELVKALDGRLVPALVAKEAERDLQLRYRFNKFPTLVLCRHGAYLGTIAGVQDWQDYLRDISALLNGPVSEPPSFEFPDGCYTAGMQRAPQAQPSTGEAS